MSRRARGRQSIEEPVINLTPLIDVVFVILIMFIVVAPLLELDRLELPLAGARTQETTSVTEQSPITIHVREDNTIWLGSQRVQQEQLFFFLNEARTHYPLARPQLFHDSRAFFGTYQMVKNALEEAGFSELDIILKPS